MPDERSSQPPSDRDPPEIKDGRPRSIIVLACGIIIALLLLLVVFNLDRAPVPTQNREAVQGLPLEVMPGPLSQNELSADSAEAAKAPLRPIAAGGWIQVADDEGQLAQQYRCSRLDPDPEGLGPGWLQMVDPELEVYLSDGRVLNLTGRTALAYAPSRIIESGTITGNVHLQLLDPSESAADGAALEPRLLLQTEEAVFDNVLGEVECAGRIVIQTKSAEFSGRRLKISLNDEDQVIQRLEIEKVDQIRLSGFSIEKDAPAGDGSGPANKTLMDQMPSPATDRTDKGDRRSAPGDMRAREDSNRGEERRREDPKFYLLTLQDNVHIEQGSGSEARTAIGDVLTLVFTMEGGEMGEMLAVLPGRSSHPVESATSPARSADIDGNLRQRRLTTPVAGQGRNLPRLLTRTAIAAQPEETRLVAPPPSAEDTIISCDGPLTMAPKPDSIPAPSSPEHAKLQLTGGPVLLHDGAAGAHVSCALLEYDTGTAQLELMRSAEHELTVISPDLHARTERFWLRRQEQRGGFTGPGSMDFLRSSFTELDRDQDPASTSGQSFAEYLHLDWARSVDLVFEGDAGDDNLGALRQAILSGEVQAEGHRLTLGPVHQPVTEEPLPPSQEIAEDASGSVRTEFGDQPGRLGAEELILAFSSGHDGEQILERLIATGDVEVGDERQTLWARTLEVTFADPVTDPDSAASTRHGTADAADPGRGELQTAIARGDVQLLMSGGARAFGDRLHISDGGEHAELTGERVSIVDGAGFIDEATRITIDAGRERYELHGPGLFSQFKMPLLPAEPGNVARSRLEDLRAAHGLQEQLRVTWKQGVEIRPEADNAAGFEADASSQIVRFLGDVYVNSPELRLDHADELLVTVDSMGGERSTVRFLEAIGGIRARSAGEPGEIRSETLQVHMETAEDGASRPRQVSATGAVHVADATQHLWTEDLTVTFRETPDDEPRSDLLEQRDAPADAPLFADARVSVDQVLARGGVQLLLPDGERVFADELRADARAETAKLLGDRVLVIAEDLVIDAAEGLLLDKTAGRFEVVGPGEAWSFAEAVLVEAEAKPIEPPVLTGRTTMEANWSKSASYVAFPGDGFDERSESAASDAAGEHRGGTLELHGDVYARSTQNPLELNTADAQHLTLELIEVASPESPDERRHELRRLIARGDAQLENRQWLEVDQSDLPRVFYIAGEQIDYDQISQSAFVDGAGELLIRDERPDPSGRRESDSSSAGFGARGTTSFTWQQGLKLTPDVDELFDVVMEGDVHCVHRDLAGQMAQLWAQKLHATVQRIAGEKETGESAEERGTPSAGAAIDLGGPMELRRLQASGGVMVRSPDRDVACDEFEYNPVTGIAHASAEPGRTVSILTRGAGRPMRAESILWNMHKDTITILRGRGSGAP